MRTEKPEIVEHYVQLLVLILRDTAKMLGLKETFFSRDETSLRRNITMFGIEHITVHLASLAKALDTSLANDTPLVIPPHFKKCEYGSTSIPVFLGFLWKCIYRVDGQIKLHDFDCDDVRMVRGLKPTCYTDTDSPIQITAVRAIRQVGYLGYKLEYQHTYEQEIEKIKEFEHLDSSLPLVDSDLPLSTLTYRAIENARLLVAYVLRRLNVWEITPRHGPGSVATGEKSHEKFNFSRWFRKLAEVYPYEDYFYFSPTHLCDELESYEKLVEHEHVCAKVVLVPKDSRGPRLISMEPLEVQWIQQGLARAIVREIEHSKSITSGYVNFTNQNVNRDLALKASNGQCDLVTLDLKDASDRVSMWLIKRLFPQEITRALFACRSDGTLLPDGRCVNFRKFAPMGSACCFPVESLVFWSLAVGALIHPLKVSNLVKGEIPQVWVYGDDIVCRKADYIPVKSVFNELSLEFNENKCCLGRFFRESCGCDAFKEKDVTPVKLHTLWPRGRWSPNAMLSYISYANAFRETGRGYDSVANYIQDYMQHHLGPLPVTNEDKHVMLAFKKPQCSSEETRLSLKDAKYRWNKRYQRYEWKIRVPYARTFEFELRSDRKSVV